MSSVVPSDFFNVTTRELWSMASIVNVAETTSAMLTGFCAAAGTASRAASTTPRIVCFTMYLLFNVGWVVPSLYLRARSFHRIRGLLKMTTDLRHAFRLLWKSKRITATTLVTLALCIGATTAIFSSVYSLMLKPLPYQEPERIVELYSSVVKSAFNHMPANVPFYLDHSQNGTSYESLGLGAFFYGLVGEKDAVVRTPGARRTAE